MNIVNICVNSPYTDGFLYQENLLPKYQKQIGNNVTVIACDYEYSESGEIRKSRQREFTDNNGVKVRRISASGKGRFKRFKSLYTEIEKANPDIIFCHMFQFLDLRKVIKYKKLHPDIKLYIDSHADFYNSARGLLSRKILHGIIWKNLAKKALPYTEKFYGVTPGRVDFLIRVYGVPDEKTELLPLCADDDLVQKMSDSNIRESVRKEFGISEGHTLLVTGGKIDRNKPQTLNLMRAVNKLNDKSIKLIVFGSVDKKFGSEFFSLLSDSVLYAGWKTGEEIYSIFAAADLAVFPGLHSVLWEQAVGMGKPCVFKRIPGFEHIDLGGNCMFFDGDSTDEYIKVISRAVKNINKMSAVTNKRGIPILSYKNIAKKSIGE